METRIQSVYVRHDNIELALRKGREEWARFENFGCTSDLDQMVQAQTSCPLI